MHRTEHQCKFHFPKALQVDADAVLHTINES